MASSDELERRSRLNQYRQNWLAHSLGDTHVNTYTHLAVEDHARMLRLVREHKERVPQILAKLVHLALDVLDDVEPIAPFTREISQRPAVPSIAELTNAILESRFPGDTGAARLRQNAFVLFIVSETAEGRAPTASSIARLCDCPLASMTALTRTLEQRGIIMRQAITAASKGGGKRANALRIRPDAIKAFSDAHFAATGKEISSHCPSAEPLQA